MEVRHFGRFPASPDEGMTVLNEGRRNAHCVLPSPDIRFVYIPYVKDTAAIFQYSIDAKKRKLAALEPKNAGPPKGTGPRHMVYYPTKSIVYFSNEQLPGASLYQITDSLALKLRQVRPAFEPQQNLTGVYCRLGRGKTGWKPIPL